MPSASEGTAPPSWLAPQGPQEGLSHYVEVIREHLRLIIACVIVATAVAGIYAKVAAEVLQGRIAPARHARQRRNELRRPGPDLQLGLPDRRCLDRREPRHDL